MTTHDRFLEFAAAEIDFPLARSEREALEHHLDTCSVCRAEAAALRSDARAMAELPQIRLDPQRADHILGSALVRKARRPNVRLVALAALLALAVLSALAVGAELLRDRDPQDPLAVIPPPSIAPSNVPAPPSITTTGWALEIPIEAGTSLGGVPVAIAESNGRLVAIGRPVCTTQSDNGDAQCVAQVGRSVDGRTWTAVTSGALEFFETFPLSGPQIGMLDIAGSADGFVAVGYDGNGDGALPVAVWTSANGEVWERPDLGAAFADARVIAVSAGGPGWVIVGKVHAPGGPRGAVWTSRDGRTWTRAADGPVFDVGGYFDTLEEPFSGSLRAVVADGDVVVAVGNSCDGRGGACRAATWRSADAGATWFRAIGPDVPGNLAEVIRADGGYMAFGETCTTETRCTPIVASSVDGTAWTSTPLVILPGDARVFAAVAVDGGIVAGASRENGLIVIGTRDGTTWEVLQDQVLQPSVDATPPPGFASLDALGGVKTATGGAIFVGHLRVESDPEPFSPLVIHVDAGSP